MLCLLISPLILALHVVHKGLVHHAVTSLCGVITGKVPVAQVAGACFVQVLDALEDDLYGNIQAGRSDHFSDLIGDLIHRAAFV